MKKITSSLTVFLAAALFTTALFAETAPKRPNILFAIADDWGWHAGIYGDPVVKTPTFDRIAREGVLFNHAFISSPSCTPSRSAILTGQWHWRLGGAGNLWSVFPDRLATYPELLEKAGYQARLREGGRLQITRSSSTAILESPWPECIMGCRRISTFSKNSPHRAWNRSSGSAQPWREYSFNNSPVGEE